MYLNGTKVFRSNLPIGTVSATTLAAKAAYNDTTLYADQVPPALLVAGGNVVAVEVTSPAGRARPAPRPGADRQRGGLELDHDHHLHHLHQFRG